MGLNYREYPFVGLMPKFGAYMGTIGKQMSVPDINVLTDATHTAYKVKEVVGETGEDGDYVCYFEYDKYNWDLAKSYMESHFNDMAIGGCSGVFKNGWHGRNYDWYYNEEEICVIKVPAIEGERHGSIGVAGFHNDLTRGTVEKNINSEIYMYLPFYMQDGRNDADVMCSIYVVPTGDKGISTGTIPEVEERERLCQTMICRYILDNFSTAKEAAEYVRDYVSFYSPVLSSDNARHELHCFVMDKNDAYAIEFVENRNKVIDLKERPYITNFYLYDTVTDENGYISYVDSNVTDFGAGIERYNIIVDNYDGCDSFEAMKSLMTEKIKYTNLYNESQEPYWYSELVGAVEGFETCTVKDIPEHKEKFEPMKEAMKVLYEHVKYGRKDPLANMTWLTVHTSIYDPEGNLHLFPQENGNEYIFTL